MKSKFSYASLFKDPRWQKKRLEVMQRDEFLCRLCSSKEETLNVHHAYYVSNRNPWDYPLWSLTTLCESCHSSWHHPDNVKNRTTWELIYSRMSSGRFSDDDDLWDLSMSVVLATELGVRRSEVIEKIHYFITEEILPKKEVA